MEKTFEYVFRGTDIDICVYRQTDKTRMLKTRHKERNELPAETSRGTAPKTRRERPRKDAVIVKANGRTYADLVKGMKEEVKLDHTKVQISSMRRTRKGDLLMEVKSGAAEDLKTAITKKFQSAQVVKMTKDKVIHIKGLDVMATIAEVDRAVRLAVGGEVKNCKVTSLRPAHSETKNATVILDVASADLLLKLKEVKIGLVECQVRERQNWNRCYKCWVFGHREAECKGPDRRDLCMKCAEPGHKAKECSKPPNCPICSKVGHRAGGVGCCQRPQIEKKNVEDPAN